MWLLQTESETCFWCRTKYQSAVLRFICNEISPCIGRVGRNGLEKDLSYWKRAALMLRQRRGDQTQAKWKAHLMVSVYYVIPFLV